MTKRIIVAAALLTVLTASPGLADEMSTVRTLYGSAAYEEALALLEKVQSTDAPELVDQYKALCFLALGRPADAERALEVLAKRQPRFEFKEAEVSPRLIDLFQKVRQRTLPATLRAIYARGKASFDAKRFDEAAEQFRELASLAADGGLSESDAGGLRDLIELGEGFLALAEAEVAKATAAKAAAAKAAAAKAAAAVPPPVDPPAPSVQRILPYTAADQDVLPPVDLARPMPAWIPSNPLLRNASYRGVLEIVVNETGAVESALVTKSISPLYDSRLLEATAGWRFQPAMKDGKPVKFRKALEVVLRPSER
jgi:hypothetical protein